MPTLKLSAILPQKPRHNTNTQKNKQILFPKHKTNVVVKMSK